MTDPEVLTCEQGGALAPCTQEPWDACPVHGVMCHDHWDQHLHGDQCVIAWELIRDSLEAE